MPISYRRSLKIQFELFVFPSHFPEILDFMSVQEIDNPDLLTGPAREKIAKLSGRTIEDLNKLLFVYKQSLIVYIWLQEK